VDFLLSQNNYLLLIVALVAGLALAWPSILRGRTGVRHVAIHEAVQLVNQKHALFIDIRSADLYKAGHIAQSRHLPVADFNNKRGSLPRDKPIIVVCDRGRTSLAAASALRKLGFAEVYGLEGGLQNWAKAGMPLSRKS